MLRYTVQLAIFSIREPRNGLRHVLDLGFRIRSVFETALLVSIMGTLLSVATIRLSPTNLDAFALTVVSAPAFFTMVQLLTMAIVSTVLYWAGRIFGGKGNFTECMTAIVWLQVILLLFQIAQFVAQIILPFLGFVVTLLGFVAAFYLIVNFVKEVHGFRSGIAVVAGILIIFLGTGVIIGMLLRNAGLTTSGVM